MGDSLAIRRNGLESAIRTGIELVRTLSLRLEQAEELLDAAYEELDPDIDRDPRFLAVQGRYQEICRTYTKTGEVREAYRAIGRVRREIAAAEVGQYLQSVIDARAEAFAAAERLEELKRELERLQSDERRQAEASRSKASAAVSATDVEKTTAHVVVLRSTSNGVEAEAQRRGISRLVHYTRVENLPLILEHGLLPRAELEADSRFAVGFNDSIRADRRRDCSCLSIQKINYLMFWEHSMYRFPQAEWCILHFDVSLLWKQSSIFCQTNAASSGAVRRAQELGWTGDGLASMFSDPVQTRQGVASRSSLMRGGLPSNETSDPQAEVLVEGRILREFIRAVIFRRQDDLADMEECLAGTPVAYGIDASQFAPRQDFSFWKRVSVT
jgi:hypothetical protein